MIVLGIALEKAAWPAARPSAGRLALKAAAAGALIILYGATLFLTELLSNATVAVLITPLAVALGRERSASARAPS
jgi:Na+/H+ antiporter NhaD/arsenite permease-like protein